MRKYFILYKASIMTQMQYAKGYLLRFIGTAIHIFIFFMLWKFLYSSGQREIINGYTFAQMIWYVTFTELICGFASSNTIRKKPTFDIATGQIAYIMNKPYSYTGYIFANFFGECTIIGIIDLICSILLGLILIGPLTTLNIVNLPFILLVLFLGVIITTLIRLIISYLSFWVENSEPFQWLYKTIFLIFGVTFPIGMLPTWLRPIIRYSPIYSAVSGPVEMIVKFNLKEFANILFYQIIYIFILGLILKFEYNKGVKKLNVNGG